MKRRFSLKELEKLRKFFAQARLELDNKTRQELLVLHKQLREAIRSLISWSDSVEQDKGRMHHQDKILVQQMSKEVDDFDFEIMARLREMEEEERLHRYWEARLLPEPAKGKIPTPDYPLLSSYASDDLIAATDESWLPTDRWHSKMVGVAR